MALNGTMGLMRVTLRPATASDREFVESVYFETQRWIIERLFGWRGDDMEHRKFEEGYVEERSEIIAVDGVDIGWLSVDREDTSIELEAIYLLRVAQNQGVGTTLIQAVVEEARAKRVPLTISTAKINPARSLYERLGFVVTAESEFKVFMVLH